MVGPFHSHLTEPLHVAGGRIFSLFSNENANLSTNIKNPGYNYEQKTQIYHKTGFIFLVLPHGLLKGSLSRDFRLQVFFINQCPSGPWVWHWECFEFSKIRGYNREWMFVSGVKDTCNKREKCFGIIFFHFLSRALHFTLYTLHLKIEFLLIFNFQM